MGRSLFGKQDLCKLSKCDCTDCLVETDGKTICLDRGEESSRHTWSNISSLLVGPPDRQATVAPVQCAGHKHSSIQPKGKPGGRGNSTTPWGGRCPTDSEHSTFHKQTSLCVPYCFGHKGKKSMRRGDCYGLRRPNGYKNQINE